MSTAKISSIDVNQPASWCKPVFITIDIDWAQDEVIHDTANLIEDAGVAATWFITHDTPALERLRANPSWELGIHPNFNFLLQGDPRRGRSARAVIENVMEFVPGATAVRSHALVQGTPILAAFAACGLTHDCNDLIPAHSGIDLAAYLVPPGIIKVPHFWEDDVCFTLASQPCIKELSQRPGLKVFDFHPIHVCINSAVSADYERAKPHIADYGALVGLRGDKIGSRSSLITLLETVS